jgi:L-ribulokinase
MQVYADVCGLELKLPASTQTPCLGSAMFGAVAATAAEGGYDSIVEAAEHMARLRDRSFRPNPAHRAVYDELYEEYRALHDLFGRSGGSNAMKRLKAIRARSLAEGR